MINMKKAKKKVNIKKAQKRKNMPAKKRTIPLVYIVPYSLLAIVLIVTQIDGCQYREMLREIQKDSVKTHAVVYDKVMKRYRGADRKYCYRFSVDGVIYKGKAVDRLGNMRKTKIGDKIEVMYLRSDPSKHAYIGEFEFYKISK
jgi:hypothetical protein